MRVETLVCRSSLPAAAIQPCAGTSRQKRTRWRQRLVGWTECSSARRSSRAAGSRPATSISCVTGIDSSRRRRPSSRVTRRSATAPTRCLAGNDERHASAASTRTEQIPGNLLGECCRAGLRECPRVGQDEVEGRGISQLRGQRLSSPACQYRDAVYRLYPGWVVIECDDFAHGVRHRRLDALFQTGILDR